MNCKKIIQYDLVRYTKTSSLYYFIKALICYPGFRYTFFLRLSSFIRTPRFLNFLFICILRYYSYKYGFQINACTKIGKGLYIGHFGNIIISKYSIIGDNCNLSPGVVIGRTNRGEKIGSPIIGNKVWIGSNSVVVGRIKIGNNVLIAPLTYINFNIPDDSIVIGNPAKIIESKDATKGYIENTVLENYYD